MNKENVKSLQIFIEDDFLPLLRKFTYNKEQYNNISVAVTQILNNFVKANSKDNLSINIPNWRS